MHLKQDLAAFVEAISRLSSAHRALQSGSPSRTMCRYTTIAILSRPSTMRAVSTTRNQIPLSFANTLSTKYFAPHYSQAVCNRAALRTSDRFVRKWNVCRMSTAVVSPVALPTPTPAPESVAGANPIFAQCMLRINDPKASHDFYTRLGMTLLTRFDFPKFQFSLYFYGYTSENTPSQDLPQAERAKWLWSRPYPTVELTWNWPADTYEKSYELAEKGETTEQYVNGNSAPEGFGHISVAVQDVAQAISVLKSEGVASEPDASAAKSAIAPSAAVVKDPETYHIQLAGPDGDNNKSALFSALDPVYSSVMLRVKDPRGAIPFFQRLGMRYLTRIDNESEKSTHYYLAYTDKTAPAEDSSVEQRQQWLAALRECTLHLVHKWGSEDGECEYANGNVKPHRGFGHVGFIIDDIYSTTEAMEKHGYKVIRKPSPFADVGDISFVEEPSTKYWVELITREGQAPPAPYEQPRLTS